MDHDSAVALLHEYTQSQSLRKHGYTVAAAMEYYANKLGQDPVFWSITGLLHDFDYEKYPTMEEHPFVGCKILKELGYPEEVTTAILGHAKYSGVARESLMAKALFACDELCGLITAATYVRTDRDVRNLEVSSVKKKMKDKAFAKGVDREDIRVGAAELEIELDEHIENVIQAIRLKAEELGLAGK